ncbi:B-box zinc finger protein [Gregarina niphandrodes]|uniref:B-box zinc finger protein n=1 Tax=Gregarina niphandrodes TaxID=110365 RepID=A0A023B6R4_GRENI|nr:B-box zinc finger protein [Gregarina niphandrodes]EZG66681.1 B-box zinc finger protein [Gregarina niphandrodes]|eukprot:XP_011130532.1 B-box zinc finger protein [Gregarina niphandrodes]
MDCKHDICVPCLYRAIQASDPNHLQQGHFSCAVCDRLVGVPDFIKYEARKPGGALDTVHPPLDHGELSKRLQEAGPLPKYCMDCNRAMVSEVQCYCMDCRAYMCPSCGEKRHQRTSESGSYRMLEHVVVRVQPNQHGNPVLITAAQPMVQEENRYIPNAEGSGLMDKPAGSSPGAYSSGGYTAGCYPGGWCGRRPGGVGRSGYCNIITEVTSKPTTSYSDYVCETHPDQPVQFTCMTCKSPCLCAFCCIGADSAHGKGHIVMDLATAWDRIEYEINGSEMAKRNAAKDELQRLSEVSGSVAVHMHQLIKLLLGAVDSSFKILDQELLRCRDTSISSVNATFAHLVDTLNAVIDDDYIKAIARPMYALPGVLRSRGITVVKSYSAWARTNPKGRETPRTAVISTVQ